MRKQCAVVFSSLPQCAQSPRSPVTLRVWSGFLWASRLDVAWLWLPTSGLVGQSGSYGTEAAVASAASGWDAAAGPWGTAGPEPSGQMLRGRGSSHRRWIKWRRCPQGRHRVGQSCKEEGRGQGHHTRASGAQNPGRGKLKTQSLSVTPEGGYAAHCWGATEATWGISEPFRAGLPGSRGGFLQLLACGASCWCTIPHYQC